MIVLEKKPLVKRSNIGSEGISFGIKEDGLAHIFNVLRNQLYSNKILAVIREYSCNAFDAHVEAGKAEIPFEITAPTLFDLNFSVRDFGSGLSPDQIKEVYAFYGESTKRHSNLLVGQLGLGSKSGFAYGENFVIKSHYQGKVYIYNAYIDESKKGEIRLISEEPSDSTGVEIVIPVKPKDTFSFQENIKSFFKFFKVKPTIKNINQEQLSLAWTNQQVVMAGDGWEFLLCENKYVQNPTLAIMGNVAYPINGSSIDGFPAEFYSDFIVEFQIGELEVSASRESLQFSTATQNVIKKRFAKIQQEITKQFTEKVDSCLTLFDAKAMFDDLTSMAGRFYKFNSLIGGANWKGQPIQNNFIEAPRDLRRNVFVSEITKSPRSGRIISRRLENPVVKCSLNSRFYIDDTKNKYMSRLAHYVYDASHKIKKIYVVRFYDDKTKESFLTGTGIDKSELVYVSSEPVNKITYSSVVRAAQKEIKHLPSAAFVLNLTISPSKYIKTKSECFLQKTFDLNAGGVYIHIDKFHCKAKYQPSSDWGFVEPQHFIKLLTETHRDFYIDYPEIVCFKSETIEKIKDNPKWKSLEQFIIDYIAKNWTDQKQKICDHIKIDEFRKDHGIQYNAIKELFITAPLINFISRTNSMIIPNENSIISVFRGAKVLDLVTEAKPSYDPHQGIHDIFERYNILKITDFYLNGLSTPEILKKYILMEEKSLTLAKP